MSIVSMGDVVITRLFIGRNSTSTLPIGLGETPPTSRLLLAVANGIAL